MTYINYIKKVLSALQNNPRLFNKELIKGLFWMQSNNEDVKPIIEWVEEMRRTEEIKK